MTTFRDIVLAARAGRSPQQIALIASQVGPTEPADEPVIEAKPTKGLYRFHNNKWTLVFPITTPGEAKAAKRMKHEPAEHGDPYKIVEIGREDM